MGNVQSEAAQESETAKNGEERASADRGKPDRGPCGTKHELGGQSPGLQTPEPKAVSQPLSGEPGPREKQSGPAEMGKNHSKKSKLKLSSMWAQNSASSGMKEAGLCDKEPGIEKRGLACLGRADLQSGQSSGSVLQEEIKGLKVALRSPPVAAPDPRDLKRASAKGKGKPENLHLAKHPGGLLLPPEKWAEAGHAVEARKDATETEASWAQPVKSGTKEYLDNEGPLLESLPLAKKPSASSIHGLEAVKTTEDPFIGPRPANEKCAGRSAPFGYAAPPGEKKALLSWEAGPRDKEPAGQPASVLEAEEDFRTLGLSSPLPMERAEAASGLGPPQAAGGEAKPGAKGEALGAEGVSSEMMQEVLERGLNFLYKVTIQSGAWPPSIRTVKQKAGGVSSGISYADVLKQCPQKKAPASVPVLPKALHHLTTAGKKLPAFKGLERSNPEELSPLSQLFFEHLKKATPKEAAPPAAPSQQVVTFFEELSTGNTKRPEWQRPRPPTPYPQRRKGQGRKLPKFGTAVSQVVAFLGSEPKCDWFVQDESQGPPEEAAGAGAEGGKGSADAPGPGDKEAEAAGASRPPSALTLEQALTLNVDELSLRPWRRPQRQEGGIKEMVPAPSAPYHAAIQGFLSPPGTTLCLQKEEPPPVPPLGPRPPSPTGALDGGAPAPGAPVRLNSDPRVAALAQARTKIRKQGPSAPKGKEKLKPSGQPKAKAPKGKGQKPWARGYGVTSPLRLESVPLFPPFEKVARPFYFGEPVEVPLLAEAAAGMDEEAASAQASPEQDGEGERPSCRPWPAFQVADSCSQKCYCRHREQRRLPKNVVAWLSPSTNHLAEPPWVATAILAVSLVAGTKFCLDSYEQQRLTSED